MAKTKSTAIDFTKIMAEMLNEYGDEVRQEAQEVVNDLAPKIVNEVKSKSPKESGKYAEGWVAEKETDKFGYSKVVIYNKNKPTLTHLLENGHRGFALQNGGRTRDVAGKKHIAPTQKWAEKEAVKEMERKLKA